MKRVQNKGRGTRRGIIHHLLKQIRYARSGGLRTILFHTIPWASQFAAALPIVLIIRVLGPLIKIRFSAMHSSHIGAFAGNTEVYLCERDLGMHGRRIVDIFYHSYSHSGTNEVNEKACNQQLKKMWGRTLNIHGFAKYLDRINQYFPGGESHKVSWRGHRGDSDIHGALEHVSPHLSFTEDEERRGWQELADLGIPQDTPFVCFFARDSSYLSSMFPQREWGMLDHRDASIQNLVPAAEEMTRRGYFAIRLGAVVNERIQSDNPMVIDYAFDNRSDFLDLFLCANCHFFFGGHSGLDMVPKLFRKPIAYTNFVPVIPASITILSSNSLLLPKKAWLREQSRDMTFKEMVSKYGDQLDDGSVFEELGIEFRENTSDEVLAVVMEMDDRLAGRWQTSKEDQELHQKFVTLFEEFSPEATCRTRMSSDFLQKNQHLLDQRSILPGSGTENRTPE